MKNKAEKQSQVIYQMLEEIHSSYHTFHLQQDFAILSQSSHAPEISQTLSDFLQTSLRYFLAHINNFQQLNVSKQKFHKDRIANLIVSCREFLQEKNMLGSCAFGLCYSLDENIFCFRSQGIQIYLLNEQRRTIQGLAGSSKFGLKRRFRNKASESLYFSNEMPKIKAEFLYEQNDFLKKKIYFQRIDCMIQDESRQSFRILMGCPETFDLISTEIIFKQFEPNSKKSDCEKINLVLEEAKKNIKSVYRQDLSLICWKIANNNQRASENS